MGAKTLVIPELLLTLTKQFRMGKCGQPRFWALDGKGVRQFLPETTIDY